MWIFLWWFLSYNFFWCLFYLIWYLLHWLFTESLLILIFYLKFRLFFYFNCFIGFTFWLNIATWFIITFHLSYKHFPNSSSLHRSIFILKFIKKFLTIIKMLKRLPRRMYLIITFPFDQIQLFIYKIESIFTCVWV